METSDADEEFFLRAEKLWDFMERVNTPRETTDRVIRHLLDRL
jgi:hypothetical protein